MPECHYRTVLYRPAEYEGEQMTLTGFMRLNIPRRFWDRYGGEFSDEFQS